MSSKLRNIFNIEVKIYSEIIRIDGTTTAKFALIDILFFQVFQAIL